MNDERMTRIETVLMQLQYDLEQLQQGLNELRAEQVRLRERLDRVESVQQESPMPPLDPNERPPHY